MNWTYGPGVLTEGLGVLRGRLRGIKHKIQGLERWAKEEEEEAIAHRGPTAMVSKRCGSMHSSNTRPARVTGMRVASAAMSQGLTLVHFPAQSELFLTQNTP